MKNILFAMTAVSALAAAAPAAAQQYPNYQYPNHQGRNYPAPAYGNQGYANQGYANGGMDMRIERLRTRLQTGIQQGRINRREAETLRLQIRDLTRIERQYSRNGISQSERQDLRNRVRNLRQQIRYAEGGANAGYGNYDAEDRYDDDRYDNAGRYDDGRGYQNDGRYDNNSGYIGDRIDSNRDGYDDRDYDRDGRWDDDQGDDRYQQPSRGGLGGIIQDIFGGGGLRVGQRASGNLYGVPYEYRGQFRDGNGAYYRSDGRSIYQIDARTDTVVRIYPMNR